MIKGSFTPLDISVDRFDIVFYEVSWYFCFSYILQKVIFSVNGSCTMKTGLVTLGTLSVIHLLYLIECVGHVMVEEPAEDIETLSVLKYVSKQLKCITGSIKMERLIHFRKTMVLSCSKKVTSLFMKLIIIDR